MNKDSLKLMLEDLEFQADRPYTVSRYLSKKYEKDPDFFAGFFGEPELYKKWRLNPISGLRSLPHKEPGQRGEPDPVNDLLAKNPGEPGQSGKDTRKEILQYWAEKIAGTEDIWKTVENPENPEEKKRVLNIPEEEMNQAKEKAKAEIYNRIWKGIPPDIVLHRLTIPDDKVIKLVKFIYNNMLYPDPEDPRNPKVGDPDYERKKQVMDALRVDLNKFKDKMKSLTPSQRARYLFNMMVFAKGGPRPKPDKGAPERGQFKAIKEPGGEPKGPPEYKGSFKSYKRGRPYISKKKRGID